MQGASCCRRLVSNDPVFHGKAVARAPSWCSRTLGAHTCTAARPPAIRQTPGTGPGGRLAGSCPWDGSARMHGLCVVRGTRACAAPVAAPPLRPCGVACIQRHGVGHLTQAGRGPTCHWMHAHRRAGPGRLALLTQCAHLVCLLAALGERRHVAVIPRHRVARTGPAQRARIPSTRAVARSHTVVRKHTRRHAARRSRAPGGRRGRGVAG